MDPHSPIHGLWKTLTLDYRYTSRTRNIRDVLARSYNALFHEFYFAWLLGYVAVLYAAFGMAGVYYGFSFPSVIVLLMSGLTNYVAHTPWLGYQTHDCGRATNAWWMALFNCGEGWHNNHHHDPSKYTNKEKWWEFDLAGTVIGLVKT